METTLIKLTLHDETSFSNTLIIDKLIDLIESTF